MNHALISDILLSLAACSYVGATLAFGIHLAKRGGSERASFIARRVMAAGIALHASHLVYYAFAIRICPMKSTNLGVSAGALAAGLFYLIARKWLKIYGLGIFVAPISLLFLIAGRFVATHQVPNAMTSKLLPLHVTANVVGDALFLLASGAAAMYLFQERRLKTKRGASLFGRLPPLDALDRASHTFLLGGFLFMTIGVAIGTVWVSKLHVGSPAEFVRVLLGYVSWGIFSGVLLLRATLGWRGRRAAYGTLAGFACALLVILLYLLGVGSTAK